MNHEGLVFYAFNNDNRKHYRGSPFATIEEFEKKKWLRKPAFIYAVRDGLVEGVVHLNGQKATVFKGIEEKGMEFSKLVERDNLKL